MTTNPLKLVFMGTPDFAVPSLDALHQSDHFITRIITQPDRPRGRGRRIMVSPVKQRALELGYDISQPASARGDDYLNLCIDSSPDLLVVVAYGNILPEPVITCSPLGAINLHASLLPKYRGAAPIQWPIINGDRETGVTTMRLDTGIDTGDILLCTRTPIQPNDTAATLHDRLAGMGAELLVRTLNRLAAGEIEATPQDNRQATYAPLLNKKDGQIDWHQSASAIERRVRGMTPWPGTYTFQGSRRLKILRAAVIDATPNAPPGTVVKGFADELRVATGDGILTIVELQGASGKRLSIADYLRGHPISPGTVFS
ncbi:MAG: methionyl-tRNA formyltransferase [Deltaproteobacteria bacterium]|nr:MAG: methionyl-tRNA formyltransferase [Deltaproteobacteria bacterium]